MTNQPSTLTMRKSLKNMSALAKLGLSCVLALLLIYFVLSVKFILS